MKPVYDDKGVTIYHSHSLFALMSMPSDSVDSIVTDPPYGLSFMGKKWDYDVPSVQIWREVLRVLKPGGHLLSFAGSRTYHRMAVNIEDAGFEIRDQMQWIFGSGFPKSLDVGKAIDKANGKHERDLQPFGDYVKECRLKKEWSLRQLDEAMGTNTSASWWEGRKSGIQPPGVEMYSQLKEVLNMDNRFDELIEWLEANREVIGKSKTGASEFMGAKLEGKGDGRGNEILKYDITAPATSEAKQWDGWGTALKPAHEPIVVARKPLEGTVAENVLKHGTGGINIDGGRIGTDGGGWNGLGDSHDEENWRLNNPDGVQRISGRFPANIIFDAEAGAMLDKQSGELHGAGYAQPPQEKWKRDEFDGVTNWGKNQPCGSRIGDSGGASRFFYCAKASKQDRDEGLEGMPLKECGMMEDDNYPIETGSGNIRETKRRNVHPTVKPTDLMQYLCRLVTPPSGTTLDPFMGSGSTGKAAVREGFKFIGCEREAEYIPIAKARINAPAQVTLL